jgi:hypothetical protein
MSCSFQQNLNSLPNPYLSWILLSIFLLHKVWKKFNMCHCPIDAHLQSLGSRRTFHSCWTAFHGLPYNHAWTHFLQPNRDRAMSCKQSSASRACRRERAPPKPSLLCCPHFLPSPRLLHLCVPRTRYRSHRDLPSICEVLALALVSPLTLPEAPLSHLPVNLITPS